MRRQSLSLFRSTALSLALLGVSAMANAQDVDGKLAAYKAASSEATSVLTRITDANSANANLGALDAALKKQRASETALNEETKKLKLTDRKDADKLQAVVTEQRKVNEALSAQQIRILGNPAAGDVVGKVFMAN